MTSSNGNIFRVTGHLCGKFTGPRWISHTKASDAELWCLLWSKQLSKQWRGWWFETPSWSLWRHRNEIMTWLTQGNKPLSEPTLVNLLTHIYATRPQWIHYLPHLSDEEQQNMYSFLEINTLRPRQNDLHFADDTFKPIFLNENIRISIKILLKFVPKVPINNIPALVQIMAWRRPGDKPLSEPMMVWLLTHICVTRPQWVKVVPTKSRTMELMCHWSFNANGLEFTRNEQCEVPVEMRQ